MSEFFKAELKDKFLQYADERDDYFEVQLLYDEFLRPNYSLQFVENLIKEIMDYDPNLLDIMSGNGVKIFMLSSTGYTEDFIEEGGFKQRYIQEEEKWDTFLEQLSNTRKLSSEEKAMLGNTEKGAYKRERLMLFVLIGAVAFSFLFSLFSMMTSFFKDDRYVSKEEFEAALSKIEKKTSPENSALQLDTLKSNNKVRLGKVQTKLQAE
ncbi:hypothetical protein [uncultured Croceitalea sp.]|uniref:hypothetical protein n=1 Tax=uncultured Croceitalea sp. TaxID=1798908 RepID=UPI003305DA13